MSTVMEDTNSFKTVLGFGTLLGEDGRAMHKSWGNSIEFNEGADKIGVDVMRWLYARTNPSDNLLFGYKHTDEVRRRLYLIIWNIYKFFIDYVLLEKITIKSLQNQKPRNTLDKWILSRYVNVQKGVDAKLIKFDAQSATSLIENLIDDLSTWYIRRSRNRIWLNSNDSDDKSSFYSTLYTVLKNLSVIIAPFMPYLSEEIFTNLTDSPSVHLEDWPNLSSNLIDKELEADMELIRSIVEKGHSERKNVQIPLRQPLSKAIIYSPEKISNKNVDGLIKVVEDELNIKKAEMKIYKEFKVVLDTKLTKDLKDEGEARKIIRMIQSERKKIGLNPEDYVKVMLQNWPLKFEKDIKSKTQTKDLIKSNEFKVERT
jgi:isoleucyl-tRNA synthetase